MLPYDSFSSTITTSLPDCAAEIAGIAAARPAASSTQPLSRTSLRITTTFLAGWNQRGGIYLPAGAGTFTPRVRRRHTDPLQPTGDPDSLIWRNFACAHQEPLTAWR